MLKFIVTGGTSFIGRQVVRQIVNNGDFVYVICRKESPSIKYLPNNDLVKIIYLDFNNIDGLNKIINQADIFLNLAWTGGTQKTRDDAEIQKANVRNSLNALYVADKLGCKYFFEAGSQSELGICNCLQTEELPFNPFTEYAKGKEEVYRNAIDFQKRSQIKYVHLRIFSVYGEGDHPYTLISNCISKMINNEEIDLSSGNQNWNFLYVADAGKIILKVMKSYFESNCNYTIVNIASSDTRKLKEFLQEMKKVLNSKSKLNFGVIKSSNPANLNPDLKLLNEIIGEYKYTSFKDGILNTLQAVNNG